MKLKTRLIIAFLFIIFFPALLFGVSGMQIIRYQVSSIQREYGMDVIYLMSCLITPSDFE